MEYVKLIAKPNTWFKEGAEVYEFFSKNGERQRVSRDSYERALNSQYPSFSIKGTRVCEDPRNAAFLVKRGDEYQDIRHTKLSDFNIEFTEENISNNHGRRISQISDPQRNH